MNELLCEHGLLARLVASIIVLLSIRYVANFEGGGLAINILN